MDIINNILGGNRENVVLAAVGLDGIFTIAFVICSFVVAGTKNAGFNCVLTGFINVWFVLVALHIIRKNKSGAAVGFLIGISGSMAFLSLLTMIYWRELSHCDRSFESAQYSCSHPLAYSATSFFAGLLCLVQIGITAELVVHRDEFTSDSTTYAEIPTAEPSYHHHPNNSHISGGNQSERSKLSTPYAPQGIQPKASPTIDL